MDEIIYDLLLKSPQGFMLLGTLRFRMSELEALSGLADVPASLAEAQQLERPFIEMDVTQLEGSISVQFLTGLQPVPLTGFAFSSGMAPLPLNALLNSTDAARYLTMQFGFMDATHIAGGLIWQPGTPRQLIFSMLGTQRAFGQ